MSLQDIIPLEELEWMRTEFLGLVSRELRTPLTSIRGSVITLLEHGSTLHPAGCGAYPDGYAAGGSQSGKGDWPGRGGEECLPE